MFRDKPPSSVYTVNVLLTDGGMGDNLCSLVAVNHIRQNYPWINPLVWVPNYMYDFSKHVLPKNTIVRDYTNAQKKYNEHHIGITTAWKSQHTAMRTHPVDYAYHMLSDNHFYGNAPERNYLKIRPEEIKTAELPEYYAVVSGIAVEDVKRLSAETLDKISDYLNSLGLTPVYLGRESVETGMLTDIKAKGNNFDRSKGLDLINKTTLLESAAIIQGAKLYIGMDGGLTHLAGFTNTKIVSGYNFVNPNHIMPIRNGICGYDVFPIVPDETLKCRFCQTNWGLLYNHDFRDCFYKDFACNKMMTFEKFKAQIDVALKSTV